MTNKTRRTLALIESAFHTPTPPLDGPVEWHKTAYTPGHVIAVRELLGIDWGTQTAEWFLPPDGRLARPSRLLD